MKIENFEDIKKIMCSKEIHESDEYSLMVVDIKDPFEVSTYTVKDNIKNDIILSDIKRDYINIINDLSEKHEERILNKFSVNNSLKIRAKIINGINYVASNGRIGRANNIILSEHNYNKYKEEIDIIVKEKKLNLIIDNKIVDIILYRVGTIEQPGIILLYNLDTIKYDIIKIGFYPERQFLKIKT